MRAPRLVDTDVLMMGVNVALGDAVQTAHAMEASSSAFLLSQVFPALLSAVSYAVTSVTSLLVPFVGQLQRTGETLLTAFVLLSFIQALVALYQYRYDVRGQLVFPDGLTIGREDYYDDKGAYASSDDVDVASGSQDDERDASSDVAEGPLLDVGTSWAAKVVEKMNKSLVLLLPWLTRNVHNLLTKNTHLFHVGFIIFVLDSLLPFLLDGEKLDEVAADDGTKGNSAKPDRIDPDLSLLQKMKNTSENDLIRILVIGDSLGIGIGCVEEFDAEKDNAVPFALIEKTTLPPQTSKQTQGPVFPQVLARSLSYHFHRPVQWRSAGVDGGDVNDIKTFCSDVVKQEGAATDIIVVLFGMNDMKRIFLSTNPLEHLLGKDKEDATGKFRKGMELLLSEIREHAPNALVVFPALPIQSYHKNAIINVFPLGMLVDAGMGLWERQKKVVANSRSTAMYLDVKAQEVASWYDRDSENGLDDGCGIIEAFNDIDDDVLLSADGVHPNKLMYAKWAESCGHKLYRHILPKLEKKPISKVNEEKLRA
ncbi:hypothetical protein ACHAXT_000282 [Thalassiosira profunda]